MPSIDLQATAFPDKPISSATRSSRGTHRRTARATRETMYGMSNFIPKPASPKLSGLGPKAQKLAALREKAAAQADTTATSATTGNTSAAKPKNSFAGKKTAFQRKAT